MASYIFTTTPEDDTIIAASLAARGGDPITAEKYMASRIRDVLVALHGEYDRLQKQLLINQISVAKPAELVTLKAAIDSTISVKGVAISG